MLPTRTLKSRTSAQPASFNFNAVWIFLAMPHSNAQKMNVNPNMEKVKFSGMCTKQKSVERRTLKPESQTHPKLNAFYWKVFLTGIRFVFGSGSCMVKQKREFSEKPTSHAKS
jgi:hypothetical protein